MTTTKKVVYTVLAVVVIVAAYFIFGKGCNSSTPTAIKSTVSSDSLLLAKYQEALDAQAEVNQQLASELQATREAMDKIKPTVIVKTIQTNPADIKKSPDLNADANSSSNKGASKETDTKKDSLPIVNNKTVTGDSYNVPQGFMDVILPVGCVQYWGDGTEWAHINTNGQTTVRVPVKYGVNLFNGLMTDGTYLDKQSVTFCSGNTKITGSTVTNNWRGESVKNFQIVYDGKTINFK